MILVANSFHPAFFDTTHGVTQEPGAPGNSLKGIRLTNLKAANYLLTGMDGSRIAVHDQVEIHAQVDTNSIDSGRAMRHVDVLDDSAEVIDHPDGRKTVQYANLDRSKTRVELEIGKNGFLRVGEIRTEDEYGNLILAFTYRYDARGKVDRFTRFEPDQPVRNGHRTRSGVWILSGSRHKLGYRFIQPEKDATIRFGDRTAGRPQWSAVLNMRSKNPSTLA
jgi:hypothetical protein